MNTHEAVTAIHLIKLVFAHVTATGDLSPLATILATEQKVLRFFTETYGGGQVHRGRGSSNDDYDGSQPEPCSTIEVLFAGNVTPTLPGLHALAREVAAMMWQRFVHLSVVELTGNIWLVEGPDQENQQAS